MSLISFSVGFTLTKDRRLRKLLFIPDLHSPYHDKKVWALAMRAWRRFRPDTVVILGDFMDCYSCSFHSRNPERVHKLREELDVARALLKDIYSLGAERIVYIEGNHENRLNRYIWDKAPALVGLVSLKKELELDRYGVEWVPYGKVFRIGKMHITHDYESFGANAARNAVDTVMSCALIGHTHRAELTYRGRADGLPVMGGMFGWLGEFESIEYRHQAKARANWVHGFGIGYQDTKTNFIHVQFVPIIDGTCCIEGTVLRSGE